MYQLKDNVYNQALSRDKPKLKIWSSLGLMLTYKCPAECLFCYYNCSPEKGGLIEIDSALSAWQSLKDLAGESARLHITGGEPFLYWDHLKNFLKEAQKSNLGTIDSIETNAFWADDKSEIASKIRFLADHNVQKIKISYDPFHDEFVDYAKVKRLFDETAKTLGPDRAIVRWQEYIDKPINMQKLTQAQKQQEYIETLKKHPCRFTGRAANSLAQLFADKTVDQIGRTNCKSAFLGAKGVHIDPSGNVFSGVCSGIIVGNINKNSLADIWKNFNPNKKDFFEVLFHKGPGGALEKAVKLGYRKRRLYSGKCHICTELRQFFFDKKLFRPIIGPIECYT